MSEFIGPAPPPNCPEQQKTVIGPALPPHIHNSKEDSDDEFAAVPRPSDEGIGPVLPPHLRKRLSNEPDSSSAASCEEIGPTLPLHLHKSSSASDEEEEVHPESSDVVGPVLPPNLQEVSDSTATESKSKVIGPALPSHLLNKSSPSTSSNEEDNQVTTTKDDLIDEGPLLPPHLQSKAESSYGPALPPHLQAVSSSTESDKIDSDEDDVYGPLPPGVAGNSLVQRALEERALQMKLGYLEPGKVDTTVREEWMTELPDVQARNLGLGPRQFRKNERPDFSDRSSWTDTPQDKAKKLQKTADEKIDLKKMAELEELRKRDEEQKKITERHNKKKKRDKSLYDMHQEKVKKAKKEEEEEGPVRKPFNRETDLQVNRFDEAQKRSIMKKAMLLDDRFSAGQSKFL